MFGKLKLDIGRFFCYNDLIIENILKCGKIQSEGKMAKTKIEVAEMQNQKVETALVTSDVKKQPLRKKNTAAVVFLSLMIFLVLASATFWGYETVYANKVYLGINVNNKSVSGKTLSELEKTITGQVSQLQSQKLYLSADGKTLNPTLDEMGISFNATETAEEAFNIGRENIGWKRYYEEIKAIFSNKNINLSPIIDSEKFNSYINNNTNYNQDAKDATFKVQDNQVIVVTSQSGSKVDQIRFENDLQNRINNNSLQSPIILTSEVVEPEISDTQVAGAKFQVESLVKEPIILTSATKNYTINAETIAAWLVLKENSSGGVNVEFSDDKIKEFIASVAVKIDQKAIDKKINSVTNEVVDEGQDGKAVNQSKLVNDIKDVLSNYKTSGDRTIVMEITEQPRGEKKLLPEEINSDNGTAGLFDGKYIEIDLSLQRLYCFDSQTQECAYTVSTGKWSTPTPLGTRYIESKDDRAWSEKYGLYMPYWNSIGGGYGIHELPEWPSGYKEGEAHLGTPVSHGCIRLGVGSAEWVYSWAPVGTPVYIHN